MAKKKETEGVKQDQNPVLGFVARNRNHPDYDKFQVSIPPEAFFDLIAAQDKINNIMLWVKQKHFESDHFRYYTENDFVEQKDKEGNPILNPDGTPLKDLRPDFWN